MAGFRRLPKSYSFDQVMTDKMRRTSCNPRLGINSPDTAFDISSLTLNAKSPRRSLQPQELLISSPALSVASSQTDRSIEPMSVSDISDRDLADEPGHFNENQVHCADPDALSTASTGTQWLWSVKSAVGGTSSTAHSQTQSASFIDKGDSDTDSDVLTAPSVKSIGANSVKHNTSIIDTKANSVKHISFEKNDPSNNKYYCTCKQVMHFLAFVIIILGMLVLMGGDVDSPFCKDGLNFDVKQLEADLKKNVFGQHLATEIVLHHISDLMSNAQKNITILSFHGWTGIGKNYVSTFIGARVREKNVHRIIIPMEFAHIKDSDSHREQMVMRLTSIIAKCSVNLFVIDEVDKATSGAIRGLHEALQNLTMSKLEGTKVIVLLLSNSGGSAINRYLLDQLSQGRSRDSLKHDEVLSFMLKINAAQVEQEWYTSFYEDGIIDVIVPFLPLEKLHVSQCTDRYLAETRPMLGASDRSSIIERVLEQMSFFPHGMELFSSTGCRGVSFKVDITID